MTEQPSNAREVEILERTTPYKGYFQIDTYRLRHSRFGGGWTEVVSRELFERGHAAVVLPYDPLQDSVVLIEQFRVGALAAEINPWMIEAVAGIVEPGETSVQVVRREALEEAGCEVTALEEIGPVMPSPGGSSEILTLFCGRVDSTGVGGVHGLDHEHEDIRAFVVPFEEAMEHLTRGDILNANAVMTLQWLALNRDRLRQLWS